MKALTDLLGHTCHWNNKPEGKSCVQLVAFSNHPLRIYYKPKIKASVMMHEKDTEKLMLKILRFRLYKNLI